MKNLLFILLLILTSCKNTSTESSTDKTMNVVVISDKNILIEAAKGKTMTILKMIKAGENQKVLDSYYGIDMDDQVNKVLTNMNKDVLEGINKYGLPESDDIEVSTQKTLPNPAFAQDFKDDSITIVTTRSKLNGTEQFIVQMLYAENEGRFQLLNIGTEGENMQ